MAKFKGLFEASTLNADFFSSKKGNLYILGGLPYPLQIPEINHGAVGRILDPALKKKKKSSPNSFAEGVIGIERLNRGTVRGTTRLLNR